MADHLSLQLYNCRNTRSHGKLIQCLDLDPYLMWSADRFQLMGSILYHLIIY